jgi:hypothetical protein
MKVSAIFYKACSGKKLLDAVSQSGHAWAFHHNNWLPAIHPSTLSKKTRKADGTRTNG